MMYKVLGILAHPDDEVIFGWPIFQDKGYERFLLTCTDDSKRYGNKRKQALIEVCTAEGIKLCECLALQNNFYALPTRHADFVLMDAVRLIQAAIIKWIAEVKPDYLFTHNPIGEYGHGDHRLLFELVTQLDCTRNVLFTDIIDKDRGGCHRIDNKISQVIWDTYYDGKPFLPEQKELDPGFYIRSKRIYDKYGGWTWKREVPPEYPRPWSSLYVVK